MASSKVPNHDFAPAWLKIPPNDSRPSGGKHNDRWQNNRKEDSHGSYSKYMQDYMYGPLPRQRSFESYEDRRHSGSSKQRHHSIDDDYYNQVAYAGYYGSYYSEKYGSHYRSQPMLCRPGPGSREGKYHHPHSRFGQQVNGCVPPGYYDYQYDFYGDYYGAYNGRQKGDTDGNGKMRESRKERRQSGEKSKSKLEDEFPSLNGHAADGDKSSHGKVSGSSAWETPPKVHTSTKVDSRQGSPDVQRLDEESEKPSSTMYKAVVPSKAVHSKKAHNRDSPRLNGQPRIRDKKSEILRNMRKRGTPDINSNDKSLRENYNDDGKEDIAPSIEGLRIDRSDSDLLSSSLEAEQRLLREMGWNDEDDEEYVITEDDMKEFKSLSEQMKQKNGVVKPTLPKSWSPKHLNSYDILNAEAELNDTSSDSDSDID